MLGLLFGSWFEDLLFYGMPLVAIVIFIINLRGYLAAKRREKENPGTVSSRELLRRKIFTIVTAVIAVCLTAVVIGMAVLLYMVIAFM